MKVHLIDGTYELFRYFFALPGHVTGDGREVAATRGVVGSVLTLLEEGATHVGVATDHVIESFRNELWPTYKTGEGVEELLEEPVPAPGGRAGGRGGDRVADGGVRGRRRAGRGRGDGGRRPGGGSGDHLHARQGPRPVRQRGRPHRPARPAEAAPSSTERVSSRSSGCLPSRSPTTWRWWATAPTASPASRAGAPSRPARGARPVRAPRGHPGASTSAGTWTCAARRKLAATLRERFDEALLFRRIATLERATRRSPPPSRICGGPGRPSGSPSCATGSTRPAWPSGPEALAAARAP